MKNFGPRDLPPDEAARLWSATAPCAVPTLAAGPAWGRIERPPPPFVPQPDMEVINRWPDAWHAGLPVLQSIPDALRPFFARPTREVLPAPPPLAPLAALLHAYPGYPQGSQGWHDQRYGYIVSGSRVGTMLGHDGYKTPDRLRLELTGLFPNDPTNRHMRRGTAYEPVAMDYYASYKGWLLADMPLIHHRDPARAILAVSLDRLYMASADGRNSDALILVECKCPESTGKDEATKRKKREQYRDQQQLQMEVSLSHLPEAEQARVRAGELRCVNYLVQYRDAAWSGTGQHEMHEHAVPFDPDWIVQHWPALLRFDQRVRRDREAIGMNLGLYNALNRQAADVHQTMATCLRADGMAEDAAHRVATEEMERWYAETIDGVLRGKSLSWGGKEHRLTPAGA